MDTPPSSDGDSGSDSNSDSEPEDDPVRYLQHRCGCNHVAGTPCTSCPGDAEPCGGSQDPVDRTRLIDYYAGQGIDKHSWSRNGMPGNTFGNNYCCTNGDPLVGDQQTVTCQNCRCVSHLDCQPEGLDSVRHSNNTPQS